MFVKQSQHISITKSNCINNIHNLSICRQLQRLIFIIITIIPIGYSTATVKLNSVYRENKNYKSSNNIN